MITTRIKTNTSKAANARQANASTKKNTSSKYKTEEDEEYSPTDDEDSLKHDDNLDEEERSIYSTDDSIIHGDDISCLSDTDTDDLQTNIDGINDNDNDDDSSLIALLGSPQGKKNALTLPTNAVVTVIRRGTNLLKNKVSCVLFGSDNNDNNNEDGESVVSSDCKSYSSFDSLDCILAEFKGLKVEDVKNRPYVLSSGEVLARQMQFPEGWDVTWYTGKEYLSENSFSCYITGPDGWNTNCLSEAMSRAGITEVHRPHTQDALDLARSLGYPEHYGAYRRNNNNTIIVYDLSGKTGKLTGANRYVIMLKDDIRSGVVGMADSAKACSRMVGGDEKGFMKLLNPLTQGTITSCDWKEFRILLRDSSIHPTFYEGWLPQHKATIEKMKTNRASTNSNGKLVAKVNNTVIGMEGSGNKLYNNVLKPSTFHATVKGGKSKPILVEAMKPMNDKDVTARPSSITCYGVYTIEYHNASHGEYVAGLREEYKAVAESDEENAAPPTKRSRRK